VPVVHPIAARGQVVLASSHVTTRDAGPSSAGCRVPAASEDARAGYPGPLPHRVALLGPGGEVHAVARAVWITVPRPVPALATEGTS
jgi:hypothetical protein